MSFVNLHLHTDASRLDGIIKIKELVKFISDEEMPAVAITDHGTMSNSIDFLQEVEKAKANIKGIVGEEFYVVDDISQRTERYRFHLPLLAKNSTGYKNLLQLTNIANTNGYYYHPCIDNKVLKKYSDGLIALTGCLQGKLARSILLEHYLKNQLELDEQEFKKAFLSSVLFKTGQKPIEIIEELKTIFGNDNVYLEVQQNGIPSQTIVNNAIFTLSKTTDTPAVLTSDAHYMLPSHKEIHDLVLCNATDKKITDLTYDQWKKLPEDQQKKYKYRLSFTGSAHILTPELVSKIVQEDNRFQAAAENTVKVAEKCEQIKIEKIYSLPSFSTSQESADRILERKAKWGLLEKFNLTSETAHLLPQKYKDRIELELEIIKELGFSNYFLVVNDYCKWSRDKEILYGTGRGSGVASLVLYSLGVIRIDPIKYNLIFARFLNRGRKDSLPDIDLDWGPNDAPRIIDYLKEKYGKDHVAQICTYGPLHAKSAIKDICRAMDLPYSVGEYLAARIPSPGRGKTPTFEFAKKSKQYQQFREKIKRDGQLMIARTQIYTSQTIDKIFNAAEVIEGIKKSLSIHASGVIVSGDPISSRCALQMHKGELLTEYDMEGCEAVGLVKFDILKVTAIQTIANTLQSIYTYTGEKVDLDKVPLTDKETLQLFKDGDISGVFQFDSSVPGQHKSMANLAKEIEVDTIEELFDIIALFRPGILDNKLDDVYVVNKKANKKKAKLRKNRQQGEKSE